MPECHTFVFREIDAMAVQFEECQGDDQGHPFVAVDERLILGDMSVPVARMGA